MDKVNYNANDQLASEKPVATKKDRRIFWIQTLPLILIALALILFNYAEFSYLLPR